MPRLVLLNDNIAFASLTETRRMRERVQVEEL